MDRTFEFCSGLVILLIIVSGICGNILSFAVWTRGRRCKKLPGGIYLRTLAVSDTLALLIPALNEAIRLISQFNPAQKYNFFCKLEIVGRHFGIIASTWIIVWFTLERTIMIFRPITATDLVSRKGTLVLLCIIFVTDFCLNIPFGVVYGLETTPVTIPEELSRGSTTNLSVSGVYGNASDIITTQSLEAETVIVGYKSLCFADRSSIFHMSRWYHWSMDVFLIFIIPFGLMTGSNLAVLYVVVSRRVKRQYKQDSKVKAVTVRAVTISVAHCLTSGPFAMSVLIPGYYSRAFRIPYSLEYYSATVILVMSYVNHAMNFLLYSFFGSEFRRDCSEIIGKKTSSVYPDGSTRQRSGTTCTVDEKGGETLGN